MTLPERLNVARNKRLIQWLAISSLLTIVMGFWLVRGAAPTAGTISIVIGALGGIWAFRSLRDPRPGLVIAPEGLTDCSNITSAGFVPWSDVETIQGMVSNRQRIFLVHVHNPAPYLTRGGPLSRLLCKANLRACGTPVVISAQSLLIHPEHLHAALVEGFARYRSQAGITEDGSRPATNGAEQG